MKRAKPLCEATAQAWFKKLGWAMWEKKKGTYVDGHEREDVQKYRHIFLSSIAKYQRRMETYIGKDMEIVHPPLELRPGEKRIVLVVQA